jgi:hypothetical protein
MVSVTAIGIVVVSPTVTVLTGLAMVIFFKILLTRLAATLSGFSTNREG